MADPGTHVRQSKGTQPLFLLKENSASFNPGILGDWEYIPFEGANIERTYAPILEGLRELGYFGPGEKNE